MKKLLTIILIAGSCLFIACGPSKEEKEAAEKARLDSIAMVEAQKAAEDSMVLVQQMMQDSINAANMKAMQDSMEMLKAKANKPASKPKTNEQKQEEVKKQQAKEKG